MSRQRRITIPFPQTLERHLETEANPEIRQRLVLLNLLCKLDRHFSFEEICDLVKTPPSSAYLWIRKWKESGYEGIANPCRSSDRPRGRPPTLDDRDLERLKMLLGERDHWEINDVCGLIERHWGVVLSASQVARILKGKLGMHFSKPYLRDWRRPQDAEERLKLSIDEAFNRLISRGYPMDRIALGFVDEASPQTTSNTARFWHFANAPIVKNTTQYKANAIGFFAIRGNSVNDFLPDSKQRSISEFFNKIRENNKEYQAIVVVLDRLPTHRAKSVKAAAEAFNIELVYLPAYSPDLNPIEFIWKTVKRCVSMNFICSLEDLRQLISDVWENASKRISYAKSWIENFAPDAIKYQEYCG